MKTMAGFRPTSHLMTISICAGFLEVKNDKKFWARIRCIKKERERKK